jgi:hypothetical protein
LAAATPPTFDALGTASRSPLKYVLLGHVI